MRYQGQGYELRIPWRRSPALLNDFHAAHQRRFGYQHAGKKVESVTVRVRATLPQQIGSISSSGKKLAGKPLRTRSEIYFGNQPSQCQVFARESLVVGFSATGPAVVTEYTATTVVPPEWKLSVHHSGALLIERKSAASTRK
jgi:N-methylhydantoinase A